MNEKPASEKGYVVNDRRRTLDETPSPPPVSAAQSAGDSVSGGGTPNSASSAPTPSGEIGIGGPGGGRNMLPPMDFSALVLSLATQGMACLGLAPLPDGSATEVDLEGTAQTIDTLAVLEVKTKGNLTPEEFLLLRNVLTELRRNYVLVRSGRRPGPG